MVSRNALVSLNPMQLNEVGMKVGDEVEVYVKGKSIVITKTERNE